MKYIKGYGKTYQVTKDGEILSPKHHGTLKKLKGGVNPHGYRMVILSNNGIKKYHDIHRTVALHYIPNPNNHPQVNHIDGNKLNNAVDNLEWVSRSYNCKHSKKDHINRGIGRSSTKITQDQINEILTSDLTSKKLAKKVGVSRASIYRVRISHGN